MQCPSLKCGKELTKIDKYRFFCYWCGLTFSSFVSCPLCSETILQIIGPDAMICPNLDCPSHTFKTFTLPTDYAHLKKFFVPYAPPPKEPTKEPLLDKTSVGQFTIYKVWATEFELDIIVEFPQTVKISSELLWEWRLAAHTLILKEKSEKTGLVAKIVLKECGGKKISEVHDRKSVSKYLVITIVFEYIKHTE